MSVRRALRRCSHWFRENVRHIRFKAFVASAASAAPPLGLRNALQQRFASKTNGLASAVRAAPRTLPRLRFDVPLKHWKLCASHFEALRELHLDVVPHFASETLQHLQVTRMSLIHI